MLSTRNALFNEAALEAVLLRYGFPPVEARRLTPLLQRYARGAFPELAGHAGRILFACWLKARGRLSDQLPEDQAGPVLPFPPTIAA
jgi:hypothetical protein